MFFFVQNRVPVRLRNGFLSACLLGAGLCAMAAATPGSSPDDVRIHVDAGNPGAPPKPIWAFFGYDEPNYTYTKDGRRLLSEISALSPVPVYIRVHNLLTSGDGQGALKWGSTNAYTEDASGNPRYDWTIVDRIFDAWVERGMRPVVEIGFMPQALSQRPEPYRHHWDPWQHYQSIFTGWAQPPRDYRKWAELVFQWVRHCVARYGKAEVAGWYWEVWNEPNIGYWQSTPEEYFKLYDFSADAAKRALPEIRIGGPTTTGPAGPEAAKFLNDFLEHVVRGPNYATGGRGAPLDYISFHAKGRPKFVDGHVEMGPQFQLRDIGSGMRIAASFPELKRLPIIVGESDPEGCGACPAAVNPANAYRNGPIYAAYTAATQMRARELASEYGVNLEGTLTWAFEFENQPWFAGFRDLATNGIDKPVLNVFRLFGLMVGGEVRVASEGATPLAEMLDKGVQGAPDLNALATRDDHTVSVLVWNYHDDDVEAPPAHIALGIDDLPREARRVLTQQYRVDRTHSDAYSAWLAMGSPQSPTDRQYAELERSGQLQTAGSPQWLDVHDGRVGLHLELPREAVALVQLRW